MLHKIFNYIFLKLISFYKKLLKIRRFRKVEFDYFSKKYRLYNKNYFFILFGKDKFVSRNTFVNGPHDSYFLDSSINLTKKQIHYLIDVGANIGTFCIPGVLNNKIKECIAIEPVNRINKILKINISLNDLENKIKVFDYVISDKSKQKLNLIENKFNYGDNRFQITQKKQKIFNSRKLDTFINYFDTKKLIIKIDVQGFEDRVLIGSQKFIKKKVPLIIEFNSSFKRSKYFQKIINLLEDNYSSFFYLENISSRFNDIKILKNKLNNLNKSNTEINCLIL
jgi:FkbM family methyltransferase